MRHFARRFFNKRNTVILLVTSLLAAYLHFQQNGLFQKKLDVYEQISLLSKSGCDVTRTPCPAFDGNISILLTLGDMPVGLKSFPVDVLIEGLNQYEVKKVIVSFAMKNMFMGKQQKTLKWNAAVKKWQGMAILPICSTGRRDWYVTVEVIVDGIIYLAGYNFTLQ